MRSRAVLVLCSAAALAAGLAAISVAHHDRPQRYSGEWRIEPDGKLFLRAVDKATGQAAIADLDQDAEYWCEIRRHYYVGRFKTPTDRGPVAGCWYRTNADTGDSFGWYRSDVLQPGEVGQLNIRIGRKSGDAGVTSPGTIAPHDIVNLTFLRHFRGDGAKETYLVDFRVRQHGIPANRNHASATSVDGTMTFRSEPEKGEPISGDSDARLIRTEEGHRKIEVRFDSTGPYELLNHGSEIELHGEVVKSTEAYDCPKGSKVVMKLLDHRLKSQDRAVVKGKSECSKYKELLVPSDQNRVKVEIYPSYFEDSPK